MNWTNSTPSLSLQPDRARPHPAAGVGPAARLSPPRRRCRRPGVGPSVRTARLWTARRSLSLPHRLPGRYRATHAPTVATWPSARLHDCHHPTVALATRPSALATRVCCATVRRSCRATHATPPSARQRDCSHLGPSDCSHPAYGPAVWLSPPCRRAAVATRPSALQWCEGVRTGFSLRVVPFGFTRKLQLAVCSWLEQPPFHENLNPCFFCQGQGVRGKYRS